MALILLHFCNCHKHSCRVHVRMPHDGCSLKVIACGQHHVHHFVQAVCVHAHAHINAKHVFAPPPCVLQVRTGAAQTEAGTAATQQAAGRQACPPRGVCTRVSIASSTLVCIWQNLAAITWKSGPCSTSLHNGVCCLYHLRFQMAEPHHRSVRGRINLSRA